MGEDRLLQFPERRSGLQAELLVEDFPGRSIRLEGLGLAASAVQRQDELATQPLAQRMLRHEGLELANQLGVPSAGEVGVDAVLEQCDRSSSSRPISPCANDSKAKSASAGPRQTASASCRRSAACRGSSVDSASRPSRAEVLAPVQIQFARLHMQQIAIRLRHEPRGALSQSLAQPRHLHL